MWLFALFVAVPLIEIALFIQIGGLIGLWPTLAIVVLTALIGTYMVRQQGALAMGQIRGSINNLRDPSEPLAHGAMILFSGALLLTPGFFTDAVGFALLVPAFRAAAFRWLSKRVQVRSFSYGGQGPGPQRPGPEPGPAPRGPARRTPEPDVVDADFEDVPNQHKPTHGTSGWTRH